MRSEPVSQLAVSNPPSRTQSPNVWRPKVTKRERKLSDPVPPGTPESSVSIGSSTPSPRAATLRKRNTFCVKESREIQKPGWHEMRHHVVQFLLETEQSYVQSLHTIIKVYMEPLFRPQAVALIDPALAKEIFHQIPEVCGLHEKFLGQIIGRVEGWTEDSKIGDVFVNTFSKCHLLDVYKKFIGNFMRAKSAIEIAKQSRPVFGKFLEQRAKDSKGRFTLDDLLIKPVQRIPRYVLFIKDLLKHTSVGHPDHAPLQQALGELTALAERVNTSERERGRQEQKKELVQIVDGLAQLIQPQSRFIRYDMIAEIKGNVQKRDRLMILFSDMIVCACVRRKSTGFIRGSLLNLSSGMADALKHSVKWHAPLTAVSRAQTQGPTFNKRRQNTIEKMLDNLRSDEKTIQQMIEQTATLHTPHQALVSSLKSLQCDVRDKMADKRTEIDNLPVESGRIDLISYATQTPTQYSLVFPSQRIRNSWETDFIEAKSLADQQAPPNSVVAPPTSPLPQETSELLSGFQFAQHVVLQSGRVGSQLTCGSIGLPIDCESGTCLWMCSGDNYSGQVSIVDLLPSSPQSTLASITVCDSRITALAAVSTDSAPAISVDFLNTSSESSSLSSCSEEASKLETALDNGLDNDSEVSLNLKNRLTIDTSLTEFRSSSAPLFTPQEPPFSPPDLLKVYSPFTLRSTSEYAEQSYSDSCMWLGTEDGQLYIYSPGQSLRSRDQRQCVQLEASVTCIRYYEQCVYVGLSNGHLAVFEASNPGAAPVHCLSVSTSPVTCCVPLLTGIGVCAGDSIYLLARDKQSVLPMASLSSGHVIREAVSVGSGVWVSVTSSPTLHLLHVPSGEPLTSVDCTAAVMNCLQGYSPIIRQHKVSALEITSLTLTPTEVVAGTSAGVVVTFQCPVLPNSIEPHPIPLPPVPVALPKGHVGPVRFLSSIVRESKSLVISGGNGYEDMVTMTISDEVQETSNCLMLWTTKHAL